MPAWSDLVRYRQRVGREMPRSGWPILQAAWAALVALCMSGCGSTPGVPALRLSAASLAFGHQPRGTTSPAQNLTATNTGSAALSITQIRLTGAYSNSFRETNSCGMSLAAGASCTILVQFAPSSTGTLTAAVILNDNAPNSPQLVAISGTGTNSSGSGSAGGNGSSGVSFSPSSISFGTQPVEVASSPETITLSNNSGTALSISSLAFIGADPADFTENDTCGSSVAAGGTCTIVTVFTPSASGSRAASLRVADNGSGNPQTVALSGTGTHDVMLSWSGSPGAAGYDVYRGSSSGAESSTPLNSEPIAGTSYTDTSVQAGRTYCYKVTAVAANGSTQSESSSEVSATVPSP